MWALIVAGHIVGYYQFGGCQNQAAIVQGTTGQQAECVQLPPQQQPSDGGASLYGQCVLTGACRPIR